MKDIADFLDDAGNAAPKHLGAGMKYHAASLKALYEPGEEEKDADHALSDEDLKDLGPLMDEMQSNEKALTRRWFEMTCEQLN